MALPIWILSSWLYLSTDGLKFSYFNKPFRSRGISGEMTIPSLSFLPGRRSTTISASKGANEIYFCEECGFEHLKWVGRCNSCKAWDTVKAFREAKLTTSPLDPSRARKMMPMQSSSGARGPGLTAPWFGMAGSNSSLIPMDSVDLNAATYRIKLFSEEMNRVLGGGLVRGSVVLLAGDPGVGKSTLLLQLASSIAAGSGDRDAARTSTISSDSTGETVVYISGEENPEQIAARAQRLKLSPKSTYLICDVDVDNAIENILCMTTRPALVIVDSVQTMRTAACAGGAGTVAQIRESTARFVELAKTTGSVVLLIGHVTKSGDIAGPRLLEHMVDTVLYLEGSERSDYRLLRGVKNRFGSTAEVGVFAMTGQGMEDVDNPSELFLSASVLEEGAEGSAVAVIVEGSRPILAEIQCLVGTAAYNAAQAKSSPRRTSDGFPLQRLLLICAVIEKRLKLSLWSRDVFLNVVGGLRVFEPSADLAVAVTIVSSLVGMKIKPGTAFIGEIGLGGELRGVKNIDQRIAEAYKMGFTTVVVPYTGLPRNKSSSKKSLSSSSSSSSLSSSSSSPSGANKPSMIKMDSVGNNNNKKSPRVNGVAGRSSSIRNRKGIEQQGRRSDSPTSSSSTSPSAASKSNSNNKPWKTLTTKTNDHGKLKIVDADDNSATTASTTTASTASTSITAASSASAAAGGARSTTGTTKSTTARFMMVENNYEEESASSSAGAADADADAADESSSSSAQGEGGGSTYEVGALYTTSEDTDFDSGSGSTSPAPDSISKPTTSSSSSSSSSGVSYNDSNGKWKPKSAIVPGDEFNNDDDDRFSSEATTAPGGVIKCRNLYQALTVALQVNSFSEIMEKLKGSRRKKKQSAATYTEELDGDDDDGDRYSSYSGDDNYGGNDDDNYFIGSISVDDVL